jgi:hypothetical protein
VLAEQNNLRLVASGKTVSHSVALVPVSLPAAAASGVQRGQPQPAKAEPATDERPEQVALAH